MRKFYLSVAMILLSALAALGQTASRPCENPKYPVNRITNKPPVPPASWRAPQSAVVELDLTVDESGNVANAVVVSSAGKDADASVLKTVRTWSYQPAMCGMKPVEMKIHVKINLQLGKNNN
jgi:TonB family protein